MLALLAPILVFGLVISVHELGHFLAAKAMGVYAPRFSIGFGPALWKMRRGETEYVLALLPLGGYVRMASRHDETSAFLEGGGEGENDSLKPEDPDFDPEAMRPFGPRPVPENRWFESKSLPARLFILLAGVSMNAVLALVVAVGLAVHDGRVVVPTRVVGAVHVPNVEGGEALAALHAGDTIYTINGNSVANWNGVINQVNAGGTSVSFGTQRGDVTVPLTAELTPEVVSSSMDFWIPPVADSVMAGGAAARAGMQPGDSVVAVDGQPVRGFSDLINAVSAKAGKDLAFTVVRDSKRVELHVTPEATPTVDASTGAVDTVGRVGVAARTGTIREPIGVGEAISSGTRATVSMGGAIVGEVRKLVTRKASVKDLGGPIAITRVSVQAARQGMSTLMFLIAFLSINVAILNLLPIPLLDGGQILLTVAESAKGSPFSPRAREYILRVGLVLIVLLFVVVTFNDAKAWLGSLLS